MTASNVVLPGLRITVRSPIKRLMDIVGSLILLFTLAPLLPLVALLIIIDSEGPVFFRQKRIGKGGAPFTIYKFRSMEVDSPAYERSPTSDQDSRLTRVGKMLRRLSIDELPQLWNVIKGEMSLVGPRPEMPFIVERYDSTARQRLSVTPGMTGLWQISPARAMPIHENLQYDLFYIDNYTLMLDCVVLLRTLTALIRGIGAA